MEEELLDLDIYIIHPKTSLVLSLHCFQCQHCEAKGVGYLNMSRVHNDKLQDSVCIFCNRKSLEVITFRQK